MQTFDVALIQHASPVLSKRENIDRTLELAKRAADSGARLISFPELNITGHAGHEAMVREAEPVPGGRSVQTLMQFACRRGVYLSVGLAEEHLGAHYNTQVVVGPKGYVGKQRKIHLSRDEYYYFRGGTRLPVYDLPIGRVGIVICYDNEFPEPARCLALDGAEIILSPHATRSGIWQDEAQRRERVRARKDAWRMTLGCRALENGCYVLACNTAGRSADSLRGVEANHAGGCMAFDPWGHVIAESSALDVMDEIVMVTLDADELAKRRRQACFFLQTRRPDVFGALVRPTD